jgi:hypothetical protein
VSIAGCPLLSHWSAYISASMLGTNTEGMVPEKAQKRPGWGRQVEGQDPRLNPVG